MRAPEFWDRKTDGILPTLLRPLGCVVAGIAALRQKTNRPPFDAPVPVICVGNLVAGGAGKTPIALDIVARLKERGVQPHVLMRGYGGSELGPVLVNTEQHTAKEVGDEALLLAQTTPTWVSRDRAAGAMAIVEAGAEAIVMDDGFQNPSVSKDLSLLVVDGKYGFGNGRVMPAGPLRETVPAGLARADGVILLGADDADVWGRVQRLGHKDMPVLRARIEAISGDDLKDRKVCAFAGIGRPEKFFETLEGLGAVLVGCHSFDDHHLYSQEEVQKIIDDAGDTLIVTTTKDFVRLSPAHQKKIRALDIKLTWKDTSEIEALLDKAFEHG